MAATVKVEGAKELRAAIKRAENSGLAKELKQAHRDAAELVAYEAQTIVPVISSRLLESIRPSGTQTAGIVRAGKAAVPYAGPIHFGWAKRGIEPNPFLYDAADARVDEVIDTYQTAVDAVIDQITNST
jgi:hypothetical protein